MQHIVESYRYKMSRVNITHMLHVDLSCSFKCPPPSPNKNDEDEEEEEEEDNSTPYATLSTPGPGSLKRWLVEPRRRMTLKPKKPHHTPMTGSLLRGGEVEVVV